MPGKLMGVPISVRVEPALARLIDEFIDSTHGWSKVELLSVAAHALLAVPDDEKLDALKLYRQWLANAGTEPEKKGRGKKKRKKK
jgi:hypothetical protein